MDDESHVEQILWLVANEDGDITADTDRDAAIERMNDDFGGEFLRAFQIKVRVPRPPQTPVAILTLPDDLPAAVETT